MGTLCNNHSNFCDCEKEEGPKNTNPSGSENLPKTEITTDTGNQKTNPPPSKEEKNDNLKTIFEENNSDSENENEKEENKQKLKNALLSLKKSSRDDRDVVSNQQKRYNLNFTSSIKEKENNQEEGEDFRKTFIRKRNKKTVTLSEMLPFSKRLSLVEKNMKVKEEKLILHAKGSPFQNYIILSKIGEGSYGCVFKVKNTDTKNILALKQIKKEEKNKIEDAKLVEEFNILKQLSHPFVLRVSEFYDAEEYYYIATDLCKCELSSLLNKNLTENQLAVIFYQIFSGLTYLHSKSIFHRDIKPQNIMIYSQEKDSNNNNDLYLVKIIDFGTAKFFKGKQDYEAVGSRHFVAPEVIKGEYNEKCDLWSTGVVLYYLITKTFPFNGENIDQILENIDKNNIDKNHPLLMEKSEELRDLINKLLEKNIDKRISAKEALVHKWFEKFSGRNIFSNFEGKEVLPIIENLTKYSYHSKIKQFVMAFLVHNLVLMKENYFTILQIFVSFNKSGDCRLTKDELKEGLYKYKPKEEIDKIVKKLFESLDYNFNDYIEFEEFALACIDEEQFLKNDYLQYAFKFLDKKNTGRISAKDILESLDTQQSKENEEIINAQLTFFDTDDDASFNFEEFKEFIKKPPIIDLNDNEDSFDEEIKV